MKAFSLSKAYQLLEPGPVVLLTTADKGKTSVMALSWHMMVEFDHRWLRTTTITMEWRCRIQWAKGWQKFSATPMCCFWVIMGSLRLRRQWPRRS